ncbi:MAG: hypothetical protein ABW182_08030 [Sphingomonas sp.]
MKIHRILGGAAALALLASPSLAGQPAGQSWSQDPGSKCRFVAPASLTAGPTYWTGACPGGKASGIGMLRRRDGGKSGPAFYGELADGVPKIGVVDLDGQYRVGRFVDGDIGGKELEANERLTAFRTAARAARAVSARFAAQKNSASARLYADVARTLDMQIE